MQRSLNVEALTRDHHYSPRFETATIMVARKCFPGLKSKRNKDCQNKVRRQTERKMAQDSKYLKIAALRSL